MPAIFPPPVTAFFRPALVVAKASDLRRQAARRRRRSILSAGEDFADEVPGTSPKPGAVGDMPEIDNDDDDVEPTADRRIRKPPPSLMQISHMRAEAAEALRDLDPSVRVLWECFGLLVSAVCHSGVVVVGVCSFHFAHTLF